MAVQLNDNIYVRGGKPIDYKYGPYISVQVANQSIPIEERYNGLTFGVYDEPNNLSESDVSLFYYYGSLTDNYVKLFESFIHPEYTEFNLNLSGSTVIQSIQTDIIGSVVSLTTRELTPQDIGALEDGDYLPISGGTMLGNILMTSPSGIDSILTNNTDVLNLGTSNSDIINIGWSGSIVNIQGTLLYQNVENLEVKDKLIRLNKGGSVASGVSSGFEIEENNIVTAYFATDLSRTGWDLKAPASQQYTLGLDLLNQSVIQKVQNTNGTIALLNVGDIDTRYVPYTGATKNVNLNTNGLITEFIDFNQLPTTDPIKGRIQWNNDDGTVEIGLNGGNVSLQTGQETLYYVKNQTGSIINNGTVVMAAGTIGNSGRISVAPAIANGSIPSRFIMGVATENIEDGADGYVTHFGKVRGINTTGSLFGETWVEGDVLYANPIILGGLTKFEPLAPNLKVVIAIVINVHQNNGTIFVRPSLSYNIHDLHNVNTINPSNKDLLVYNLSEGYWENKPVTFVIEGDNNYIPKYSSVSGLTESIIYDNGTSVGINNDNPQATLDINGNLFVNNPISGSTAFNVSGSTGQLFTVTDDNIQIYNKNGDNVFEVNSNGYIYSNTIKLNGLTNINSPHNLYTLDKNIGDGAYYEYIVTNTTNNGKRIGTILAVWDKVNNTIEFTETSTNDINNSTSNLSFNVIINTTSVILRCNIINNTFNIKISARII